MQVCFWGTRGSLPAPLTAGRLQNKIRRVLEIALKQGVDRKKDLDSFLAALPFSLKSTYGGNTSCIQILGGRAPVLCDAGSGLRDFGAHVLQKAHSEGQPPPSEFHLFISHPHWDHLQGFPFFTPAYIPGNTIHIWGGHPNLEAALAAQQKQPWFPVDFDSLGANLEFHRIKPGETIEAGGFQVDCMAQNHPGQSYGYRFRLKEKTLVYSTDSEHGMDSDEPNYPFVPFFLDADLLVIDAQYIMAEALLTKENWGHSNNLTAVELAVRAHVKRLCLFHHEPAATDRDLERYLESTLQYLSIHAPGQAMEILMAHDGMTLDL